MSSQSSMLNDVVVVQLGVGMAPALVAKFMRELGARVTRVEPPGGDPFGAVYPAYDVWQRGITLDAAAGDSAERLDALLAGADVCLVGGEDYPGLTRRADAAALSARHPRLVVLDIEAAPAGTAHAGRPATELLVQARSGLAYEHFAEQPIAMSFSPANFGAALRGLAGVFAALYEREGSGLGQVVATSLFEGAIGWLAGLWCEVEKPTPNTRFVNPISPHPLIFRCADGVFIHLVIGGVGSKYRMYQALRIDDPSVLPEDSGMPKPTADLRNFYGDIDVLSAHAAKQTSAELLERIWALGLPEDSGMPKPTADLKNFYGDIDVLSEHVAKQTSAELLKRIWALGLPAEPVLPPGKCWDEPQIAHNGVIATDADGTRHVGHPLKTTISPAKAKGLHKTGARPLDGVRVADFGAFVAGPYASVVLADLGADVIKVETHAGDPNRSIYRFYTASNRGKRAISIDLKSPDGQAIALELCARADIVTSNFRPGASARLGIDGPSLHALKPDLIVLESPAYGSSGPLAERAGFDMVMQAYCGHEYRAGGAGNSPLWSRTSMVDFSGGWLGAIGALAGLFHRARHGDGASIDSPLVNAGIALLSDLVQRPDGRFEGGAPLNQARTGFHPGESLYQSADGWIAIAVRGAQAGAALEAALGLAGKLGADPAAWGGSHAAAIAEAIRAQDSDSVVATLEAAGVWVERCMRGMAQKVLNDPAMAAANTVQVSIHPEFGEVHELGAMLRFSRSKAGHRRHAPLRGESTRELLAELGRSAGEIDALAERKIVA